MDEISVDRLVLDIPGLNPAQARDLGQRVAQHIGKGLAAAATRDNHPYTTADLDALAVDLNDLPVGHSGQSIPRLAEAIASALLIQIGGR
jgi:hypothetical protein